MWYSKLFNFFLNYLKKIMLINIKCTECSYLHLSFTNNIKIIDHA